MTRTITLANQNIEAVIAPDNGGMLVSLKVGGTEVLRMEDKALGLHPMLAGGMPLMFPFPSATKEGRYFVDGKEYGMPMHGLLKNEAFGIKEVGEDFVTLFMTDNEAWLSAQYPYPFKVEVTYKLSGDGISLLSKVTNRGDKPLPHGIGWHPFFKATDKEAVRLRHSFTVNYDYGKDVDSGAAAQDMNLADVWDHVFHSPKDNFFTVENPVDGYSVRCDYDECFNVLVVCTTVEGAVCVEPWCEVPNGANHHRFSKWVNPGETKDYNVKFTLKKL